MNNALQNVLLGGGFVLAGLVAPAVTPHLNYKANYSQGEIAKAKESIALSLMGQMQMTFGDLTWMKSLEYLHNGIGYRMPTNTEKHEGYVVRESQNTATGLEHPEGVAMALDADRDWRGIIGEIHREVVPYHEEHAHSDPVELIPWYQLMVKLNPHLERLYSMGAFFMADFAHEPEEALELLEAGALANPWSFEILSCMGRVRLEYFKDYETARTDLERAVELGDAAREKNRANRESFDPHQKQMYEEAYLFLAKAYTELGLYDKAIETCERGTKLTGYNHLRIQQRAAIRKRDGLPADAEVKLDAPVSTESAS